MTENIVEIDWKDLDVYREYVSVNGVQTKFNIVGDEFEYDKEKRIISRTNDDSQYYYIYDDDIIYVCDYDEDEDLYFYKYNTITHEVLSYYYGIYTNDEIDSVRYIFDIYNYDGTITDMLNGVKYEPEQGTGGLEFWEIKKFYVNYMMRHLHSKQYDDHGNKFIYNEEGIIIYRICNRQCIECFYVYTEDYLFILHSDNGIIRFYKCDISKNIIIRSYRGFKECLIEDRTFQFSIKRLQELGIWI